MSIHYWWLASESENEQVNGLWGVVSADDSGDAFRQACQALDAQCKEKFGLPKAPRTAIAVDKEPWVGTDFLAGKWPWGSY